MLTLKKIFVLSLFIIALAACKDDNVPEIDETKVDHEQLLGTWEIVSTKAYVNVNPIYKPQLAPFGLEGKLQESLDNKSQTASFHFEKDRVYFIKNGRIQDCSRYELDEFKIHLDNPELIGFYAPLFYIKFSDELLVTYLRRAETMELLERDKEMADWVGIIDAAVDDAQCELRFRRSESPFWDEEPTSLPCW